MRKIPTLFKRNLENPSRVTRDYNEGTEWVQNGEGVPTVKLDGTACMIKDGKLYKRYDAKKGRVPPEGFMPIDPEPSGDGHWVGWVLVKDDDPEKHFREPKIEGLRDWTYELVGPKVRGNPEHFRKHELVEHGFISLVDFNPSRTFDELEEWFKTADIEGIVWWKDMNDVNCPEVKIKRCDFGQKRIPRFSDRLPQELK